MGILTEKDSGTLITDNDLIEISIQNRQFLSHRNNIGKTKSQIAVNKAKLMSKDFNYKT